MASEIRVDKINSLSGVGTVTLSPTGVDIAGITTAATLRATTGIVTSLTAVSSAKVGSGVTLSPDGDIFATGVTTATTFSGSGASLTNLNASNIASGTVPTARLGSGTASSSTFLRGDSTFQTVNTDLVSDTSPQLGGTLDTNSNNINFADNVQAVFGTGNDSAVRFNGTDLVITTAGKIKAYGGDTGIEFYSNDNSETLAKFIKDGAVELYHDNTKQCETSANGLAFPSGKGIDFSATGGPTSGSGTSELLDDYEEGTFTPEYNSGGAASACFAGGISYDSQVGHYTKVGNVVTFQLKVDASASGLTAKSGTLQINNLPYNCKNVQSNGGAFFVLTSCFGATDTLPNPVMITGSNGIQFYKNNAGGFAGTDLPVPSNYIQLAGVYLTD